ncbi:MAG: ABC transporter substrate-binding protein [Proteobacteria bacterium]|nr:ABC transporter substrate-binding protein [Pseudomonadota bacterium]MBU2226313.1 ABC transporter substrate-binding protein [Pseudomonadota bacterium]MBU2260547.1 ABC transporter substrate-binding protein [Pseudomonadota bacterium]
MRKTVWIVMLCVSLVLGFSAGAFAAKTLEIGALYPISGSLALLGEESWRGAEIARMQRNKAGGVAGMEVIFVQGDANTPATSRSEAERLIEQKGVKGILGTYSSSRCMVASEVAGRKGIPYFELGAIANDITTRGYKTMWRINPTAAHFSVAQVEFIIDWLAPKLGKKPSDIKVSVAHEDSDYGSSVAASFSELAKKKGLQVVSVEPYAANSSDLSSVIFRLRKAEPDIVVAVSYAQDAILLSRQAIELKLNVPFIGTGGGHSLQSFADALGKNAEGVLNVDFTQYEVNTAFTPGLTNFLGLYKETFKANPRSGHSLANYMGANVVFDILQKTGGSLDPKAVQKAAMAMDVKVGSTATGWGVKFDENGQNIRVTPQVTQWRDGKLVTVFPKGAAVMEPILIK